MMNSGSKEEVVVKGNAFIRWYMEKGILYLIVKKVDILNLAMAKVIIKVLEEYTKHKPYPCLANVMGINGITKEDRDYFANGGNSHIKVLAILITSPIMQMIANFYMMVNKPRKPTRLFTKQEQALEWLRQFTN